MKLHDHIEAYIAYRRSLSLRCRSDAKVLRSYARALGSVSIAEITPASVAGFIAGQGALSASWIFKFKILSGFYRYAIGRGIVSDSPLPVRVPKLPPSFVPYIYTIEELQRLVGATDALATPQSPLQALTMRTLIMLLYGTGMRISEALSLTLLDVNMHERILTVRDTKFFKSRLLPIGPRLTTALADYHAHRATYPLPAGNASAFFATRTGNRLYYENVAKLFRRARRLACIERDDRARYQPRLHDIRHSAVMHRVVAWYRAGADVQRLLPHLATYFGHVNLASTQRYLSMTPELLHEASVRFERYAESEVCHAR